MKTIEINRFDGGISDDPREQREDVFTLTKHFEVKKHRLIPHVAMIDDSTTNTGGTPDEELRTFAWGNSNLYALGHVNGAAYPKLFQKADANDPTSTWNATSGGASASGAVVDGVLVWYENQSKFYGLKTSGSDTILWSYEPGTTTFTETVGTFTGKTSSSCVAFLHPKSDYILFGVKNIVGTLNGATFSATALTLPADHVITSICEWGNLAAISAKTSAGQSRMYLWDMTSADVLESIDFANVNLNIVANIGGRIVCVGAKNIASFTKNYEVNLYEWAGGAPRLWKTLRSESSLFTASHLKQVYNNKLYFPQRIRLNDATNWGIFVIGINERGSLYVTLDTLPNNDTALVSNLDGFGVHGDYIWVTFDSTTTMVRSNQATYTTTSIYEGQKLNFGSHALTKAWAGVTVTFEPLPADGQVVLKYRKDEETSWTTIFTHTTDNSIRHTAINIESSGTPLPDFKELQLRVESTGGAVITGLRVHAEEKKDDLI